jgi:hypothetical protein
MKGAATAAEAAWMKERREGTEEFIRADWEVNGKNEGGR